MIFLAFMEFVHADVSPVKLRCDFRDNPLALENATPPFSWQMSDSRPGALQTAYQIQVATDAAFESMIWDSSRIVSRQSHLIPYAGLPLKSRKRYYWRVCYWDHENKKSAWSKSAWFEMGLLETSDWKAQWIEPQKWETTSGAVFEKWCDMAIFPSESVQRLRKEHWADWDRIFSSRIRNLKRTAYFRKEIKLDKPVRSARLRYSALGYCEAHLNGENTSDHLFDPVVTQYSKAVNYVTLDVTSLLRPGANALGFILGDGWCREEIAWVFHFEQYRKEYHTPAIRAQLEVEYADGSSVVYPTDASWKQGYGGIVANSLYIGEVFDQNQEQPGWDAAGFDDAAWKPVSAFEVPVNQPVTLAQSLQPQREIRRIKPVSVNQPQPGVWVFELPETITGMIELHLPASQKSTVFVRPSEWVWNEKMSPNSQYLMHLMRYPDGAIRKLSPGMIVAKRRSSSVMSYVPPPADYLGNAPIGIMTWAVKNVSGKAMTYRPKFSLQVMRYLEVTGLDAAPDLQTITALLVRNDIPTTYTFESSDPVMNRVFAASVSSFMQNTQSMSWDNSSERNQTTWPWTWAAPLNAAVGDFSMLYRKFLKDQELWFLPNGKTSGQTLSLRAYNYRAITTPIHETPVVDLPWALLAYYGDRDTVRKYAPMMRKYIDYYWAGKKGELYLNGIRSWKSSCYGEKWKQDPDAPSTNSGDHVQKSPSSQLNCSSESHPLYVTVSHWINIFRKASWVSAQLGNAEDQVYFDNLATKVIAAVRESEMRDPKTGTFGARELKSKPPQYPTEDGNPVSNGIAVMEGIARPEEAQKLADITYQDIQRNYAGGLPGGREWYRGLYLLSNYGYMDKAVEFMKSTDYPAMGFYTEKVKLTTIPESRDIEPGPMLPNSTAQAESHCFANWYVEVLCGIQMDPNSPGMQDFIIAPIIPNNLAYASLSMESPYGKIHSGWKHSNEKTMMEIEIPANSTAKVIVPIDRRLEIKGETPESTKRIERLEVSQGKQTYRFPSGKYTLSWEKNRIDRRPEDVSLHVLQNATVSNIELKADRSIVPPLDD